MKRVLLPAPVKDDSVVALRLTLERAIAILGEPQHRADQGQPFGAPGPVAVWAFDVDGNVGVLELHPIQSEAYLSLQVSVGVRAFVEGLGLDWSTVTWHRAP